MLSQTRQKLKGSWVLGAPLGVKRRASTIPLIALIVGLCCGIAVSHFLAELGNLDMADGYRWVAPVVVVSAGLVIVAVLGRLSQVSYHYWLDAETSRRQLRETIEALPAGVVLYDSSERLVMFNSTAASITPFLKSGRALGQTFEAIARDHFSNQGMPDDATDVIARFRQAGSPIIRLLPDGRWIESIHRRTPSGNFVGLRVDITELKLALVEATDARVAFEQLVDSLSDAVFTANYEVDEILYLSQAGLSIFGRPVEDMIGLPLIDSIAPKDREVVRKVIREAGATPDKLMETHVDIISSDGSIRHVEVRFRRRDKPGTPKTVTGIIRDVTEKVELERRLNREVDRLRSIVASSGAVIALTDLDLKILLVNREFERLHGVLQESVVGSPLDSVVRMSFDREVHAQWRTAPLPPAVPHSYQKEHHDPLGKVHRLLLTATPILDEQARVRQIIFMAVDDTKRHEAELAMHQTERFALVGEMAATVAHELVQPLQVIEVIRAGMAEELAVEPASIMDMAYLTTSLQGIARQIDRTNRIVGDLRGFVRGYDYQDLIAFSPFEATQAAIDLADHALRKIGVKVSLDVGSSIPEVSGHPTRLEQVVVNLLNNARDAGARNIKVTIASGATAPETSSVTIRVADDGQGIATDVLPPLFQQFVTTKPFGKGTGLGLRTCARIVREMGGTIVAENNREGGAAFTLTLPAMSACPEA